MAFGISAGAYLVAGAAVAGGAMAASSAKSAAKTQANAARDAAAMQQEQQGQVRSDLEPYRDLGEANIKGLQSAIKNPLLSMAFTAPTAAQAAATPGYQFALDQGLKSAQNSASARGLGASGAAMKGAERYAAGLADSTYGSTFNRALQSYATNYGTANDQVNRLLGLVQVGGNAAAQTGQLGTASTNSIAGTLTSGAAASAAGQVGAANALNSGISGAVNGYQNQQMLNTLMNKGGGSTLYGGGSSPSLASDYLKYGA